MELCWESKFLRLYVDDPTSWTTATGVTTTTAKSPPPNIISKVTKTLPPIVFLHGAPQSYKIFEPYLKGDFRKNRKVYLISFPSNESNAPTPSFMDMWKDELFKELELLFAYLLQTSNDNDKKIAIVAHDFGCGYAWRMIRENKVLKENQVEFFVSLSCGSSFRYDVFELGIFATYWLYCMILCLGYYFRFSFIHEGIKKLLTIGAGYKPEVDGEQINEKSLYWYWYGPIWIFRFVLFDFLGLSLLITKHYKMDGRHCAYDYPSTNLKFPTLFITDVKSDRIAYTNGFIHALLLLGNKKNKVICRTQNNHFFPSNDSETIINEITKFTNHLL